MTENKSMIELILEYIYRLEKEITTRLRDMADKQDMSYLDLSAEVSYHGQALGRSPSHDKVTIITKLWTSPVMANILMFNINSQDIKNSEAFSDIAFIMLKYVEDNIDNLEKEKLMEFFIEENEKSGIKSLELLYTETDRKEKRYRNGDN